MKEDKKVSISVIVSKLGARYKSGMLELPVTKKEAKKVMEKINVDCKSAGYRIPVFKTNLKGLVISEFDNLDEVNYLTHLINNLDKEEMKNFKAILQQDKHDMDYLINAVYNIDKFCLEPYESYKELGYERIKHDPDIRLGYFECYFNFEEYGSVVAFTEAGEFTDFGYISRDETPDEKQYKGIQDIPKEYQIFKQVFEEIQIENETRKKNKEVKGNER